MAPSMFEGLLKPTHSVSMTRPKSRRSRLSSTYAKYVTDWWLLEILSIALGIAIFVALCSVLRHYDGKPVRPTISILGGNITLNTLVSILSTISKAALLFTVSGCISQSKWSWYLNQQKPLGELSVFDEASRGAWGALQLIVKINIRCGTDPIAFNFSGSADPNDSQIASVGALLIIGGLAVVPLSQQLVHYIPQDVPGNLGSATIPAALTWTGSTQDSSVLVGGVPTPPLPMKGAIQNGLFSQNSLIPDLTPKCSTGNCTWPSYRSLAICARSANVTSHLKMREVSVEGPHPGQGEVTEQQWYLSQSHWIRSSANILLGMRSVAPITSTSSYSTSSDSTGSNQDQSEADSLDFSNSIAFKDSALPVADVFMIYANDRDFSSSNPFSATEFILEWCVQNFTTNVVNGTFTTQRQESFRDFSKPDPTERTALLTATPNDGDGRTYTVDPGTHDSLQTYFLNLIQGNVTLINLPGASKSASNDVSEALFQPFDIFGQKNNEMDRVLGRGAGISSLQRILDNTATGMTNMIRLDDNIINSTASEPVPGFANTTQIVVQVQWSWIAALSILVAGTAFFFLATLIASSGRQKSAVWKSSTLPLLKALDRELHTDGFSGMRTVSATEDWAQDLPVLLSWDADAESWKLVRRHGDDDGDELRPLK
ncbi:MAG: hypothetical protein Q9224_001869 [Gallowayella concinna]